MNNLMMILAGFGIVFILIMLNFIISLIVYKIKTKKRSKRKDLLENVEDIDGAAAYLEALREEKERKEKDEDTDNK